MKKAYARPFWTIKHVTYQEKGLSSAEDAEAKVKKVFGVWHTCITNHHDKGV